MKRFYVAHARGPDFDYLKRLGFVVMYPIMDDYVFLEDVPKHSKYLTRQNELGVSFLKEGSQLVTVSEEELSQMGAGTVDRIKVGSQIRVLVGYCEGMEGTVDELDGGKVKCTLRGWNKNYNVMLSITEIVEKT